MLSRTTLTIAPDFRDLLAGAGLADYDRLLATQAGRVVSTGHTVCTRRLAIGESLVIYLKCYRYPFGGLAWLRRRSKARQEHDSLRLLARLGVRVPDLVLVGERRRLGVLGSAMIATCEIPGAVSLADYVADHLPAPGMPGRRDAVRELMTALAEPVRLMHEAGYCDGDLHWRNWLLSREASGTLGAHVIDSPRGRRLLWRRRRALRRDLADLDRSAPGRFSRAERLRFLLLYSAEGALTATQRHSARWIAAYNQSRGYR